MNDLKRAQIEHQKRLVKYVCEKAEMTQAELGAELGLSQQNLQNKMSRGTVPMTKLYEFMEARGMAVPAWAEQASDKPTEKLAGEISKLREENEELRRRLERAESQQDKLIDLLLEKKGK